MIDKPLLAGVMALLTLSLVMSYSLSTYTVLHFNYSDLHFFIRQSVAILIGLLSMVLLSKMNPDKWFILVGLLLFTFFFGLMLLMPLLPASLVQAVGGAKRWIHVGAVSLAPVEFFKVGFVFFLAWSFGRKLKTLKTRTLFQEIKTFFPYLILLLIVVVLVAIFQKDLGQVVVVSFTLMVMLLFIGASRTFFFSILFLGVAAFVGLIIVAPHRIARIKSWWGMVQDTILGLIPFDAAQHLRIHAVKEPYQISNSLNAIHNGGFWGQGLGNGQFKLGYLSEVHTDFILAGITEELGFLGLFLVCLTFLFILYRIFKIASKMVDPIYYLFCMGVGLLIAFAFILNAYGISGITPIKGIAVPFLSYGGSHILASSIAIGMVLMVSKKIPHPNEGKIV